MDIERAIDVGFADDRAAVVDHVPGETVVQVYAFSVHPHEYGYVVAGAVVNHNLVTDEYDYVSRPALLTDPFTSSDLAFAYMQTHARQKALELRQGYRRQGIRVTGCELEVERNGEDV